MRRETPGRAGGATPSSTMRSGAAHEIDAVEGAVDAERLPEPARARAEVTVAPGGDAALAHGVDAGERRGRAQEHRVRLVARSAHRVHAPVVAVREVHVETAGRAEHRRVPRRAPPVRVTSGIVGAAVRLDLDDARREARTVAGADQHLVQQLGRDLERVAVVERPRQRTTPGS